MYHAYFSREGAERVVASLGLSLPVTGQELWLPGGDRMVRPGSHPPGLPFLVQTLGCGSEELRHYMRIAAGKKPRKHRA